MEGGDLATWESARVVVVLEGFLLAPREPGRHGIMRRREFTVDDAREWPISLDRLKEALDFARHNVAIDVWSFLSPDIADELFSRLMNIASHGISSMTCWTTEEAKMHLDTNMDIRYVFDTDDERLLLWGARGCKVVKA